MDFKVDGPWKVLSVTMVDRHEKILNSRRSRMVKTIPF